MLIFAIDLEPETNPISMPPYWIPPDELKMFCVQLQGLQDQGFIYPTMSPLGCFYMVCKKNEEILCICIVYRHLNKVTLNKNYPV